MRADALLDPALLEQVQGLVLTARRVVEGALHGRHRSPSRGLSIEFAQHRAYTPGDELRHLDWRVLARSDRRVLKQYEQETNMRVVLVLDCSRSMAYGKRSAVSRPLSDGSQPPEATTRELPGGAPSGGKFHYARVLGAALAYLLLRQGDSVGLVLSSDRIVAQVAPRAAAAHISRLCQVLAAAQPAGTTDLAGVLGQLATRLQRRSAVIVISDLLDDPDRVVGALGQLAHRGHEVLVFQVLDPRELDFELGLAGSGVTVLRDLETGAEFEAEPQLIRALVRAEVQRFCQRLDAGARAHGVQISRCRTSEAVERVLASVLSAARGCARPASAVARQWGASP